MTKKTDFTINDASLVLLFDACENESEMETLRKILAFAAVAALPSPEETK